MADQRKEVIKENWYELDYDCSDCDSTSPSVLYTSKSGLKALVNELNRVSLLETNERIAMDIENIDYVHSIPFRHIGILENHLKMMKITHGHGNQYCG